MILSFVQLRVEDRVSAARTSSWAYCVVSFSLTLPATRISVPELGPTIVGLGRAIVAAVLAGALLWLRNHFLSGMPGALMATGAGVVIGFPLFSAVAMGAVPAVHGAILVGFLPAATAVFAVLRAGERPAPVFWLSTTIGLLAIVVFAEVQGAGTFKTADVFLLLAVACAGFGYAEGARIARDIGGWRVISWALVLVAPILLLPVGQAIHARGGLHAHALAWTGFAYVSVVSMFLGFFCVVLRLSTGRNRSRRATAAHSSPADGALGRVVSWRTRRAGNGHCRRHRRRKCRRKLTFSLQTIPIVLPRVDR